ncbi:MAG: hypothetical protein SGILL_007197 [Bacillariaceae sp.]
MSSLSCECAKCTRRAREVATILKTKVVEQKVSPADAQFPDIFEYCAKKNAAAVRQKAVAAADQNRKRKLAEQMPKVLGEPNAVNTRTVRKKDELMVPKPPLAHFPTEMKNMKEIEVAEANDYYTVFSADGARLTKELPEDWPKEPDPTRNATTVERKGAEVVEDGSVDYCHYCMQPGDIICCDFCPRAFHLPCMRKNSDFNELTPDDEKWGCTICKNEKAGLADELVDGKSSMDKVASTFEDGSHETINGIEVLSMIHEMVLKLLHYDFGYMFSEPVDQSTVPGYNLVVKQPMDLGTVCSKLINGEYTGILSDDCPMDRVVAAVLKDIELVWHNCSSYNFEGSAVYRMAEVLRKRADRIRMRSFNDRLSNEVKRELEDFDRANENFRCSIRSTKHPGESKAEILSRKPRSERKIHVSTKSCNGKPIAVMDSVTGRVVLTYRSSKTAAQAVQVLLSQGHRCEWNARQGINMRLVADKSAKDPSMLLFGYRWVYLEDLRSNKVAFLEPNPQFVEVRYRQCTYLFNSADEALSFTLLPKETDASLLAVFLKDLPSGGKWKEFAEMEWRHPPVPEGRKQRYAVAGKSGETSSVEMKALPSSSTDNSDSWENFTIVKHDLVSGRNLVGFENPSAAHKDWMQTTLASPTFPFDEARTIENFKKHYLNGDRNVDGIVWRSNLIGNGLERSSLRITPVSVSRIAAKIHSPSAASDTPLPSSPKKRKLEGESNGVLPIKAPHDALHGNNCVEAPNAAANDTSNGL